MYKKMVHLTGLATQNFSEMQSITYNMFLMNNNITINIWEVYKK